MFVEAVRSLAVTVAGTSGTALVVLVRAIAERAMALARDDETTGTAFPLGESTASMENFEATGLFFPRLLGVSVLPEFALSTEALILCSFAAADNDDSVIFCSFGFLSSVL